MCTVIITPEIREQILESCCEPSPTQWLTVRR
jgi:hypothetical protein